MFESLDESERQRVRRWQAPRIGRVAPPDAVSPAFANVPRLVAADDSSSGSAASGARVRTDPSTPAPPVEDGDAKSGSAPAPDGTADDGSDAAPAWGSSASPPVERVDVGTSADDVALQRRFEEGRRQGWAEAQAARREAVVDESAALLASLKRERDGHDALLEDELIALARAMTRLILRRELTHDADALRGVVSEALSRLPGLSDAPLVHLHPVDAQAIGDAVAVADGGRAKGAGPGGIAIVADETLSRGDCRIESGATVIDASIDAWVASIGARHGWQDPPGNLSSATDEDDGLGDDDTGGDTGGDTGDDTGDDAGDDTRGEAKGDTKGDTKGEATDGAGDGPDAPPDAPPDDPPDDTAVGGRENARPARTEAAGE